MKKSLVFFTAASMLAAGVSLASNISFGQRMSAMMASAFDFIGPVSGFMHNLVKPADQPKARQITQFQDGMKAGSSGSSASISIEPAQLGGSNFGTQTPLISAEVAPIDRSTKASRWNMGDGAATVGLAYASGSVAQGILESGQVSLLAGLGRSLQAKSLDLGGTAQQDVWAHLLNKPEFKPTQIALSIQANNKQIDTASRLAPLDLQAESDDSDHKAGTAAQLTSEALVSTSDSIGTPSGKVPVPSSLLLLLSGLILTAIRFTRKKN